MDRRKNSLIPGMPRESSLERNIVAGKRLSITSLYSAGKDGKDLLPQTLLMRNFGSGGVGTRRQSLLSLHYPLANQFPRTEDRRRVSIGSVLPGLDLQNRTFLEKIAQGTEDFGDKVVGGGTAAVRGQRRASGASLSSIVLRQAINEPAVDMLRQSRIQKPAPRPSARNLPQVTGARRTSLRNTKSFAIPATIQKQSIQNRITRKPIVQFLVQNNDDDDALREESSSSDSDSSSQVAPIAESLVKRKIEGEEVRVPLAKEGRRASLQRGSLL